MAKQNLPKPKKQGTSKFNAIFKTFKGKNPEVQKQLLQAHACFLNQYQVEKMMSAIPVQKSA